ncbi:MAG: nascent polypeptide-associated complex protein [Candidatus Woesearchaeota archaeon]
MMPGIDPRAMQAAMKKMGIKQAEIEADEVVIRTPEKEIVISNPSVTKIDMMGQTSFQVAGEVSERELKTEIGEDDVRTVAEQSGATEEDARKALEASKGDLAEAIVSLKK